MTIRFRRKDIEKQMDTVNKAIDGNNLLVSLRGMIISVNESNISLIGSDGNLTIKEVIEKNSEIQIIEPGKVLVPAKIFQKIIKKHNMDVNIEIVVEGTNMTIISESFSTSINVLAVDEYPKIEFDVDGSEFKIEANVLRNLIKNVSYAAADKDSRVILNGVNFRAHEGFLYVSATNSYRLARQKMEINNELQFNFTILSKNLKDFVPENAKGELKIMISERKVMTVYDNTIILSKLIDGIFPDVERIIPQRFESKLIIDKKILEELIDKATVLNNEENSSVKIKMIEVSKELIVESKRDEIGRTAASTEDMKWDGGDFDLTFSSVFLKNALSNLNGEIVLEFLGRNKLFTVYSETNKDYIQLILPFRGN